MIRLNSTANTQPNSWMKPLKRAAYTSLLLALLFLPNCGYTLNHRVRDLFKNEKGIFVPIFANSTDELGAEMVFTNALIRELGLHGEVVLTSKDKSGLEMRGMIEQINYAPTAMVAPDLDGNKNKLRRYSAIPDEIGINIIIRMELIDSASGKVLWSKRSSGGRKVNTALDRTGDRQAASSFGLITQSLIDSRYSDIARDIMRDFYDDMVELF